MKTLDTVFLCNQDANNRCLIIVVCKLSQPPRLLIILPLECHFLVDSLLFIINIEVRRKIVTLESFGKQKNLNLFRHSNVNKLTKKGKVRNCRLQ